MEKNVKFQWEEKIHKLSFMLFFLFFQFIHFMGFSQSCSHTISLTDTYGDGWNGGAVSVSVNNINVLNNITLSAGSGPINFNFNASTGQTIRVYRTVAGSYPGEMRVQIENNNNTVLLNTVVPAAGNASTGGNICTGNCFSDGGCLNTAAYGSSAAPSICNNTVTFSCTFQSEFNTVTNVIAGDNFTVNSPCGGWVTVRYGSYNGSVVSSGGVPLTWNAASSGSYYLHWNTNGSCGTATNCCNTTITKNCPAPASPNSISPSNATISCTGQSATLNVNGSIGTTYWFLNSCGNTVIGSGNSIVVSPSVTSTYYARNYSNGQWSLNCASATVTVNPSPSAPANPTSNSPQCSSVTITRSGSPPSGTTWYWQGTIANGTSTTLGSGATYTATSSGTYYIRAQNSDGCWSSISSSINIVVDPYPSTPSAPSSNSPQCTSVTITRSGTPPTGITWYWQGTNNNGTSTSLGSGATFMATSSGTYYLRAQNSTGCWSNASASITVSITNTPLAPNNPTSNSPQCTSSTITRSGTPPTGTTWYWQGTNSNGTSTSLGSGTTYTATTSGTYYIRSLNSSGCWSSNSGSVTIVISGIPSLPLINTTSATCYGPGTATISNYNSSQSYNFSPSGPSVSANGEVSGMTYNTVYTVVTLNSTNCQSGSSNSFSITPALIVPSTPAINVIASSCTSNGTASISNYDNSQTYSFTPIGPVVNSIGSILGTTTGIAYTVATSNSNCISTQSQVFTIQNQLLVPNTPGILSSSANQNICDSILITRNSNPPTGVIWYWQGTNPTGTSTSFGSGASYYAQSSGTYYLRAKSSDGCWSNSSSSIQVNGGRPSNPTNPISNAPQCDTMIVSFNGSPADDVIWYWQGTSPNSALTIFGSLDTIYITTSGTYYVRALNSWGCWSLGTGSIQVNVGRPSTPNALTSNSPNCEQVIINRTGVVPSLTGWYWQGTNPNGISTLNSGPSFIVTNSGTYYLRARNLNNCWSNQSSSIDVLVHDPSIEQQQVTNCGPYNWIDGNTYSSDTIVTYIYPQTTVNGCDSSVQLILNINPIHSSVSDIMACESYTWIDGNTYFSDTLVPAITLNSIYGCDSLVSLNLMIGQPLIDTTIIDTTANQSFDYNGMTYTESGIYYQTLADQFGCDSIVQLNLIIQNSDLNNLENMNLTIYPNPSLDGRFLIKTDSQFELIKLIDFSGREVHYKFQDNLLDLNNLSRGVYFAIGKIDGELIQFKLVHSD
ncbi:MAG: T9SS type A sorting domain-containing protein [Bacteroidetes bacterium]|nr:T9SS type A sorting domain-containing protein [Bacteroidota bacterium]